MKCRLEPGRSRLPTSVAMYVRFLPSTIMALLETKKELPKSNIIRNKNVPGT